MQKDEKRRGDFKRGVQVVKRKQGGVKSATSKRAKETKLPGEREMHILGNQN